MSHNFLKKKNNKFSHNTKTINLANNSNSIAPITNTLTNSFSPKRTYEELLKGDLIEFSYTNPYGIVLSFSMEKDTKRCKWDFITKETYKKSIPLYSKCNSIKSSMQSNDDNVISKTFWDNIALFGEMENIINDSEKEKIEIKNYLTNTNFSFPLNKCTEIIHSEDGTDVYVYIEILDEIRNLVKIEKYGFFDFENGKLNTGEWMMLSYGVFELGHTYESFENALSNEYKNLKVSPLYKYMYGQNLDTRRLIEIHPEVELLSSFVGTIYTWNKTRDNRDLKFKEITSKRISSITKGEYKGLGKVSNKTSFNSKRVIDLSNGLTVYTNNENVAKNIKKRERYWHVTSFTRRGGECKRKKKDGSYTYYMRRGITVHPKNKNGKVNTSPIVYKLNND